MSGRGRLCFFVPQLYPVAAGGAAEFAGGTEVRNWALARALAERGFDVKIATCDYGQGPVVQRGGVGLFRTYSPQAGIPGVRLLYPRLWKTMHTLREVHADVYLANGAGLVAGWTYDAARLARSRFVLLAAHDTDALRSLPLLTKRRERWWYLRALHGANAIVAQTERQRELFRDSFAVDAHVIANPVDLPARPVDAGANNVVLWLSTYKPAKRPEWFLELARRLPQFRFRMVGFQPPNEPSSSWQAANDAASVLPNLEVHGFVAHSRVGEVIRDAGLFVLTSPLEGFSNALLEAWSYGVPCVTTVDSDGVVARHQLGEVVGSIEQLVEAVAGTMTAPHRRRMLGVRAREYVERHHGPDRTFEPLATLLDRTIGKRMTAECAS